MDFSGECGNGGAIAVLLRDGAEEEALSSKPFRRSYVRLGNDSGRGDDWIHEIDDIALPKDGRYVCAKECDPKTEGIGVATP